MANAKAEFLEAIGSLSVVCAQVGSASLISGYSVDDYQRFLSSLNFDYDDGFGSQELHGTVWFSDGSWMVREECDGSEWWEHRTIPVIPDHLAGN